MKEKENISAIKNINRLRCHNKANNPNSWVVVTTNTFLSQKPHSKVTCFYTVKSLLLRFY